MYSKKKFAQNVFLIVLSRASGLLSFLILVPIMTSELTQGQYGVVDLVITYGVLAAPLAILSLQDGAFRHLVDARGDIEEMKRIISSSYLLAAKIYVFVALAYLIACMFIGFGPITYATFLYFTAAVLNVLTLSILRGMGAMRLFTVVSLLNTAISSIGVVLVLQLTEWSVAGVILAFFAASALSTLYGLYRGKIARYIKLKSYNKNTTRELLRYSLPLAPNAASWWVFGAFDRTAISIILGVAATGIYAVTARFASLMTVFQGSILMAWQEAAALYIQKKPAERDAEFSSYFSITIRAMSTIGLGVLAMTAIAFPILVNDKFAEAYVYIPVMIMGGVFNSVVGFYSAIYGAKKMTRQVMNTTIAAAVVNITITLTLIWWLGIWAAAIASVVAYGVLAIYRHIDMKKHITVVYKRSMVVEIVGALLFASAIYYIAYFVPGMGWLAYINLVLVGIAAILLNRHWVSNAFRTYKKRRYL